MQRVRAGARARYLLTGALWVGSAGWATQSPNEAWQLLEAVSETLSASPRSAAFVQVFQPVGFSAGDHESGVLEIGLPDCLRWQYQEPFAKTFLLCQHTAYTWNEGETAGRRFVLDREQEPGLDLLRLDTRELRAQYEATTRSLPKHLFEVVLTPHVSSPLLTQAVLTIDGNTRQLLELEYLDPEGNLTRFEFSDYRSTPRQDCCSIPTALTWIDE